MSATIHFEGLPGSGKTTASEDFCKLLRSNGVDASLWLEIAPNHPVMRKEGHALFHQHDFPQNCLDTWLTFLKSSNNTVIFDGYALQSTVRHLYANGIAQTQIEAYFNRWQELAPETTLIFFLVDNPPEHYDIVFAERGDEWASKLYRYVEHTPVGVANILRGKTGFLKFWSNYQQLCLELLHAACVPVHFVEPRSWEDRDLRLLAAKVGLLPELL